MASGRTGFSSRTTVSATVEATAHDQAGAPKEGVIADAIVVQGRGCVVTRVPPVTRHRGPEEGLGPVCPRTRRLGPWEGPPHRTRSSPGKKNMCRSVPFRRDRPGPGRRPGAGGESDGPPSNVLPGRTFPPGVRRLGPQARPPVSPTFMVILG